MQNLSDDEAVGVRVISRSPLVVRRRVLWGECDPAQVVYTPRFADYMADAFGWFRKLVMNAGERTLVTEGMGSPVKSLSLEFHKVLRPDELFDLTVRVGDIRTRTFDLRMEGRGLDGVPRFAGVLSPILIAQSTFTSVPIPPFLRDRLTVYRSDQGDDR